MVAKLYLIHGYIGSGKTTFSKKLEKETKSIRFTMDEWIINFYGENPDANMFSQYEKNCENMILTLLPSILNSGQSAILDYGFWTKAKRNFYKNFALENDAKSLLYNVICDEQTAIDRVVNRTNQMPEDALFIDKDAYKNLKINFEPIQLDEEFVVIE